MTKEERELEMLRCYDLGWSDKRIADVIRRSWNVVAKWRYANNLPSQRQKQNGDKAGSGAELQQRNTKPLWIRYMRRNENHGYFEFVYQKPFNEENLMRAARELFPVRSMDQEERNKQIVQAHIRAQRHKFDRKHAYCVNCGRGPLYIAHVGQMLCETCNRWRKHAKGCEADVLAVVKEQISGGKIKARGRKPGIPWTKKKRCDVISDNAGADADICRP